MTSVVFASFGSAWLVMCLVIAHALSLLFAASVVYEYRRMMLRRARFVRAVESDAIFVRQQRFGFFILWMYLLSVGAFTIVSSVLFIVRPHWL